VIVADPNAGPISVTCLCLLPNSIDLSQVTVRPGSHRIARQSRYMGLQHEFVEPRQSTSALTSFITSHRPGTSLPPATIYLIANNVRSSSFPI